MIVRLLFENPYLLVPVWLVGQFAVIALWSHRRQRWCTRLVWLGFAALPALLVLQHLVVTPREQIITLCRDLAGFVEEGDLKAIRARLSRDLDAEGMTRDELITLAEWTLSRYHVTDARLSDIEISFAADGTGTAQFKATCGLVTEEAHLERMRTAWCLRLRRTATGWEVIRIEMIKTPFSPLNSLHQLTR